MDVSIIIVSWKVKELLRENLKALFRSTGDLSFEVFVVDNHSADGTLEMVAKEFPQVNLIANNYNAGFAAANNQAMEMAQGDFILLLNPDMRVFPDTLLKMHAFMKKNKEVGVASCRLVDEEGGNIDHVRKFPTFLNQLAVVLKIPHIFPGVLNNYLMKGFDYDREAEVDSVRGAFFMISREVIDAIGKLDPIYFIWFEEVDYCMRVKSAGRKVVYTPEAKCIDYVGKSFSQVARGETQKYFRDSMLKYFKRWHSFWSWFFLYLAWPLGILLANLADMIKIKKRIKT